ncbi:hypothetical protein LINGRAHAP2_LOCUS33733 [Linum grandiflorum]
MTKLVAASLMVLLGCCSLITAFAKCGDGPNTYVDFPYNLKAVLDSLVTDTTPAFPRYRRYYPDTTTAGSAIGIARCRTDSEKECSKCLGDARDSLVSCKQKTTGNYGAVSCSMLFWQVTGNN